MHCEMGLRLWNKPHFEISKVVALFPTESSRLKLEEDEQRSRRRRRLARSAVSAFAVRVAVETDQVDLSHPLPILNVSEHLTRVSLQLSNTAVCSAFHFPSVPARFHQLINFPSFAAFRAVVGGLLGTQNGREVEIMNSFELVIDAETNKVDFDYFVTRKEQCQSRPIALSNFR